MALKFSEMTALRVDLARNLEAGFDNFKEEIAAGYDRFVTPLLEDGETAPDVCFQMELMKRGVARSRRRLASFDSPVLEQAHEDARVSAAIQARAGVVDGKLRRMRHACRGLYGDEGVRRAGLVKEPPPGAVRLHEHGKAVKEGLEGLDGRLEPVIELDLGADVPPPAAQLAARLDPELSELGELVGDRHEENRKGAAVRLRRKKAIADFDREIRAIVRTAQGLFRMAGREDLAERFRPLLRRALRRTSREETEGSAEPEAPTAGETEAATAAGTATEA